MTRNTIIALAIAAALAPSCAAQPPGTPNNPYGTHLIIDDLGERGRANLSWTRQLVGRHGYVKSFFFGITEQTKGSPQNWRDFVSECYRLEMIPVIRLGGVMRDGSWQEPYKDTDGSYRTMANVFRKVVSDLPRSDVYPLYVEIWNEPNLDIEWSGKSDLAEYAQFFVEVSRAIRSLGDSRIKILNGAFALSAEATEQCIKAHPDFINAFDVWASHPYPQNHPPEYNVHAGNAKYEDFTIDGYLLETRVLEKYGRKNVKVMITETGYPLGNGLYESEGFPPIAEYNRADYMMRAFRDYYPKWPEVLAVFPFLFSDPGWAAFNWVPVDSGTDEKGWPTKPTPMYTAVANLAKPTDSTGAISGTVTDRAFGTRLAGAEVSCPEAGGTVRTDEMGNFQFPKLKPGDYSVTVVADGFARASVTAQVRAGVNSVADFNLAASKKGTITGMVVDGMTGQPLEGVTVALKPGSATCVSDARGEFAAEDLPPIAFSLSAGKKGYTTHILSDVRVPPGESVQKRLRIAVDRAPAKPNMAGNPSFEQVADEKARPWAALRWEPLSGGAVEVTDEMARTGNRSLKISVRAEPASHRQITHYGTMEPGKTYTGSVWISTEALQAAAGGGAWMTMAFTNNAGAFLKEIPMPSRVRGSSEWQYFEVTGVAPEGAQRLSLNFWADGDSGAAYFDDGFLGKVD